jgi:hypothetical protein
MRFKFDLSPLREYHTLRVFEERIIQDVSKRALEL